MLSIRIKVLRIKLLNMVIPRDRSLGSLFLIYINDIINCQQGSNLILFADDTTAYKSYSPLITDPNLDVGEVQSCIQSWFLANRSSLNSAKAQLVNFSLRVGSPLDGTSDTAKFLGVYLDKKLTWEEHAINLGKRLPKIIFQIKNLTKSMSISTVLAAYHSYFVSVASYSILNWPSEILFDKPYTVHMLGRSCV